MTGAAGMRSSVREGFMGKHGRKKDKKEKKLKKLKKLKKMELKVTKTEIPDIAGTEKSPETDNSAEKDVPLQETSSFTSAEIREAVEKSAAEPAEIRETADRSAAESADKADTAERTAADLKKMAGNVQEKAENVKEKAGNVYENIKEEADRRTRDVRTESRNLFQEMKLIWQAYFADPQETLNAQLLDREHNAAWAYFVLSAVCMALIGFLIDGMQSGIRLSVIYVLISFCYPLAAALLSNAERRISLADIFPVFWTANLFIYAVHAFSAAAMLLGLWFLALAAELLALPLSFVFSYIATLSICGCDTRRAVRTTIFTVFSLMLLLTVLLFFFVAFSILNSAFGQMMEGGFSLKAVLEFLSAYIR